MTAARAYTGRGASPRTARAINDRLALGLLQREGPLTAGQLKELTGMSRPSVADLVERLKDSGLIEVVGESGAARRGPNARVYGIVAERAYVAGLDVRVESVGVEIADLLGHTLVRAVRPVAPDAPAGRNVAEGVAVLRDAMREAGVADLHTAGFGAPGLIDPVTGRIGTYATLPAWHGDLVDEVRKTFDVPVLLENEVNLAAVAELRVRAEARAGARGDARPAAHGKARAGAADDTFVLLWIGGGVGAAVVLDGHLRRGASGGAGEVGFLPVSPSGALPTATDCDNGYHGLVGSRAVCALARAHGVAGVPAGAGEDAEAAAAAVRAAVADGAGGAAEAFLADLAGRIALGAAAVCAVIDPGRVVLAGEIGQAGGTALAARVGERLAAISPLSTAVEVTGVGVPPVLRGAVIMAMDAAQDALFAPPA